MKKKEEILSYQITETYELPSENEWRKWAPITSKMLVKTAQGIKRYIKRYKL